MENTNILIAANIQRFRKTQGLTQNELAEKLGVTFQAVSKWENAQSAPDISLLPVMADIFVCSIDELFSRETSHNTLYDNCAALPWADDGVIRGVVCEGKKILQVTDSIVNRFTFEIDGEAKHVHSECNIKVRGPVSGGCEAGNDITVEGSVSGGCISHNNTVIAGSLSGGCNSGHSITIGGNLSGGCNTGTKITVGGSITGDISCGGPISVEGDVKAALIKGNVICDSVECEHIDGDVTVVERKS